MQAATARALTDVDEGRPVGPLGAYAPALRRVPRIVYALALPSVALVITYVYHDAVLGEPREVLGELAAELPVRSRA